MTAAARLAHEARSIKAEENVELHRSKNTRGLALKGILIGVGLIAIGTLGLVVKGPGGGAMLVGGWVVGGFVLLVGLVLYAMSFRPFRFAFDDRGLAVTFDGQVFEGSWDHVQAIGIERLRTEEERYGLVLWVPDWVPMRNAPTFPPDGDRSGHFLMELDEVRESKEEIALALRQYAGAKFKSAAATA